MSQNEPDRDINTKYTLSLLPYRLDIKSKERLKPFEGRQHFSILLEFLVGSRVGKRRRAFARLFELGKAKQQKAKRFAETTGEEKEKKRSSFPKSKTFLAKKREKRSVSKWEGRGA